MLHIPPDVKYEKQKKGNLNIKNFKWVVHNKPCSMFVHYSCEDLQDLEWTNVSSGEKFNTGYYYRLLTVAQVNIIIINKRLQYY